MKHQTNCNYVKPKNGEFSVGLELEFFIRSQQGIRQYFKDVIESYGETFDPSADIYELEDIIYSHCSDQTYEFVFGFDGAGTDTPEFRTPVFISSVFEKSLDGLLEFAEEIQTNLVKEYKGRFRPIYESSPYGLHFSVGGSFLSGDYYQNILKNCKILQPKLIDLIPDSVVHDYIRREDHYPGELSEIALGKTVFDLPNINGLRTHPCGWIVDRLEIRFFPSCFVYSMEECLRFILFDSKFPTKKIKFSRC